MSTNRSQKSPAKSRLLDEAREHFRQSNERRERKSQQEPTNQTTGNERNPLINGQA